MRQIIRLDQLAHIPTPSSIFARPEHMEEARRLLVDKMHIVFDNATGTASDYKGIRSYVRDPSRYVPYEDENAVFQGYFLGSIIDAAQRLRRGTDPLARN